MKRKQYLSLAALSVAAIGSVYAAEPQADDARAIATAKINMAQAITAAEQYVGDKASRAEYEQHSAIGRRTRLALAILEMSSCSVDCWHLSLPHSIGLMFLDPCCSGRHLS